MRQGISLLWFCLLGLSLCYSQSGTPLLQAEEMESIDVQAMQREEGIFPFYWDDAHGRVYLELKAFEEPFLYVSSLASGLGSNPVGLDRGQMGGSRVVAWKRVGDKAFLIQQNLKFRATTDSRAERSSVRDSFAESILWAGELQSISDGAAVVDLTEFLLRDAHHCVATLAKSGQGSFSLDKDRCFIHRARTKGFPNNCEFEATLTFASNKPGALVEQTAADGRAVSLRQHHSFVRLPDQAYRPRRFDPRAGCFSIVYSDYGVALDQPLEQRFITRHRLQKRNPELPLSPPVVPIVYYVDSAVPQPIRDALLEGAGWWSSAFESAGFSDAFEVRLLPDDVDPMDVRYNVIQWVHRSTRGWSYGQSVVDPRTGEIIKGHVLLGSLRIRQDQLLLDGLMNSSTAPQGIASSCGMGEYPGVAYLTQLNPEFSTADVALARIRQLAAHEVGHTLGFAHNFAASTFGDRASVMDYPPPRVKITDGEIDLSDAYAVGVGAWDRFTVAYAYSQFAPDEEPSALEQLVAQSIEENMRYVTDADARSAGAAHPLGNLWDDGSDPVAGLRHAMEVRRIALGKLNSSALANGRPMGELEKIFAPLYLHHRYQVDAAAKLIGGVDYTYAVKADGQVPLAPVPPARQRAALAELLGTLQPDALVIPQSILELLSPRVVDSATDRERFASQTAPLFDAVSAMRAATDLTLANLLQPQRVSRLAGLQAEEWQAEEWGLASVLDGILHQAFQRPPPQDMRERQARRVVQQVVAERFLKLADAPQVASDARAMVNLYLKQLTNALQGETDSTVDALDQAHVAYLVEQIDRFRNRPHRSAAPLPTIELPPGSPIGAD